MNTLPNKITLCRIVLIPVFMLLAYQGFMLAAFLVYIILPSIILPKCFRRE